jgi:hypothetical protein
MLAGYALEAVGHWSSKYYPTRFHSISNIWIQEKRTVDSNSENWKKNHPISLLSSGFSKSGGSSTKNQRVCQLMKFQSSSYRSKTNTTKPWNPLQCLQQQLNKQ